LHFSYFCYSFISFSGSVVISTGVTVSGTIGVGDNEYEVNTNDVSEFLVIVASITDSSANVNIQVTNQDFEFLQTISIPDSSDEISNVTRTVCSPADISQYRLIFSGTDATDYSFVVSLYEAELEQDNKISNTGELPVDFWYFDVDRTNAPLEVTVKSDDEDDEAIFTIAYERCPDVIQNERSAFVPARSTGEENAFLTFSGQARFVIAKFDPELEEGRWFFAIFAKESSVKKEYKIEVDYGLKYDNYYKRTVLLIVAYPFILVGLALIPFGVTFIINQFAGLDKYGKGKTTKTRVFTGPNKHRTKKKWEYLPFAIAAGLLFSVPAAQVGLNSSGDSEETGDRDICFVNEFCAKPDSLLIASNSIWSNVGYLWSGIILLLYVMFCKKLFGFRYLIPKDSFLILAFAVGLFFVGVMSAIYHTCPSRQMFQFDTAFMFVCAGLGLIEVYRKYFKTYWYPSFAFVAFAILMVLNLFASLIDNIGRDDEEDVEESDDSDEDLRTEMRILFRAVFTAIFTVGLVPVFYHVYLKPRRTAKWKEEREDGEEVDNTFVNRIKYKYFVPILANCSRIVSPFHPVRLLALLLWAIGMYIIIWTTPDSDLSSMLLNFMVVSFLFWLVAFTLHKIIAAMRGICCPKGDAEKKELKMELKYKWLVIVLWVYLLVSELVLWMVAIIYFSYYDTSDKTLRPAESRMKNNDCVAMNFWDTHDVWHVIGAVALFHGGLILYHLNLRARREA